MRRMSFALTTDAVIARQKTVTRRLGWLFAKPGMRLLAVDKLRTKNARRLAVIEIVSVRRERLWKIYAQDFDAHDVPTPQPFGYSAREVRAEGFAAMDAVDFAEMFRHTHGLDHDDVDVTRIEFRYVECYVCGARATCVHESVEGRPCEDTACDEHCGHGDEDGRCWPLEGAA